MGIKIPPIGITRDVVIYEYSINPQLPDSLRMLGKMTVDSSSKKVDSTFWTTHDVLPLTAEQNSAYLKLDSTQTLEKKFAPSGAAMDFMKASSIGILSYLDVTFNRIEAWHLGISKSVDTLVNGLGVRGGAAYGTADHKWKWHAGATWQFGDPVARSANFGVAVMKMSERMWSVAIDAYDRLEEFPLVLMKDRFINIFNCLLSHSDAYDYYSARGGAVSLTYVPGTYWHMTLTGLSELQRSLSKNTEYSFFNRSEIYPDNPSIIDGQMNTLKLGAIYSTTEAPGMARHAFKASVAVEHSAPSLNSDYSLTQMNLKLRGKISTSNYDLLFPPSLTIVLNAGTTAGHLPPQRYFSLASNVLFVGEQGTVHGTGSREFYGDRYAECSVEYNFRRAPFALTGIRWLYESKLEFILTAAAARTWFSDKTLRIPHFQVHDTEGWYYEAGIGVSNILDIFRVDLTYRFTQPRDIVLTLLLSDFLAGLAQ
jgi:hypothetical protein